MIKPAKKELFKMSKLLVDTILKDSENFRDLVHEPTRLDRSVPGSLSKLYLYFGPSLWYMVDLGESDWSILNKISASKLSKTSIRIRVWQDYTTHRCRCRWHWSNFRKVSSKSISYGHLEKLPFHKMTTCETL